MGPTLRKETGGYRNDSKPPRGLDRQPRYIAPMQPVAVIRQNHTKSIRGLSLMRWGLVPSGDNSSGAGRRINARSETSTRPCSPCSQDWPLPAFRRWVLRTNARESPTEQPFCFEITDRAAVSLCWCPICFGEVSGRCRLCSEGESNARWLSALGAWMSGSFFSRLRT